MHQRTHAARAATLLESGGDEALRYAALELRMAMEAIAYDKLRVYARRLPSEVLDKWQPPQAMRALLLFEPRAMHSKRVRYAAQGPDGQPPGPWIELGEHRSFDITWLRKAYNKIGSYLHQPAPFRAACEPDPSTLRADLREILAEVKQVAESRLDGALVTAITFQCAACDAWVVCNEEGVKATQRAVCLDASCSAEHVATFAADGTVTFHLIATDFDCVKCSAKIPVEDRRLRIGYEFSCPACKAVHVLAQTQWGYGLKDDIGAVRQSNNNTVQLGEFQRLHGVGG